MQTILGSGGAIGIDLAKELKNYTREIRLVSRNPIKVNPDDQLVSCDLIDYAGVLEAVKDSEIVYLTAGLKYDIKIWQSTWPKIIENVINACKTHHARLVFFDNIYMYDPDHLLHITEETPVNPSSKKGKVRAQIARTILDESGKSGFKSLIARSADFYGPGINNSVLIETVYKNLKKGKKAYWFCSLNFKHSCTFTPDAAKAVAMLGNDEKAYGQVWHMPTAHNPMTGKEWIDAFAREMNVKSKIQLAPKWMIRLMGLFNPIMKEFVEMLYQYDRDYIFDSTKFEKAYNFAPTPYLEGIRQVINH